MEGNETAYKAIPTETQSPVKINMRVSNMKSDQQVDFEPRECSLFSGLLSGLLLPSRNKLEREVSEENRLYWFLSLWGGLQRFLESYTWYGQLNTFLYEVAIKKLINESQSKKAIDDFERESETMKNLKYHVNVLQVSKSPKGSLVQMYGICLQPIAIITEYMERGSLWTFLSSTEPFPDETRDKIVLGIARGMLHLVFLLLRNHLWS